MQCAFQTRVRLEESENHVIGAKQEFKWDSPNKGNAENLLPYRKNVTLKLWTGAALIDLDETIEICVQLIDEFFAFLRLLSELFNFSVQP